MDGRQSRAVWVTVRRREPEAKASGLHVVARVVGRLMAVWIAIFTVLSGIARQIRGSVPAPSPTPPAGCCPA